MKIKRWLWVGEPPDRSWLDIKSVDALLERADSMLNNGKDPGLLVVQTEDLRICTVMPRFELQEASSRWSEADEVKEDTADED